MLDDFDDDRRARQRRQVTVRLKPLTAMKIHEAAMVARLRDDKLATAIEYFVRLGYLDNIKTKHILPLPEEETK